MDDVVKHADVTRRMIELGKSELLNNVADPKSGQSLQDQLHEALDRAGPPADATQPTTHTAARTGLTVAKAISQLDIVWGEAR